MTQSDQPLFDVIFRGDIAPGHQLLDVKAKMAKLFKADMARIDALFVGGAIALKKNLDQATAEKYQAVLKNAGADVQLAEAGKIGKKKSVQKKPAPAVKAASPAEQPMTLQQRLAAQEAEREQQEARAREEADRAAQQASAATQDSDSGFTLAPVGAELLEGVEKEELPEVVVDISQMTLRPQEGDLVDDNERFVVEPVSVQIENYGLSELGDDLLHEDEKQSLPLVEVAVPEVDIAPVGSDMGQLKGDEPPPPPDTSGLSIKED